MRRIIVLAASMGIAGYAAPAPQGDALIEQVRAAYPETVVDSSGLKVTKPGTVLVLQADGLMANPVKSGAFGNTFEGGRFVRTETGREKMARFGINVPPKKPTERPISVGAKFYLLGVEVGSDAVHFTVQTCGDCDPKSVDPAFEPYRAKVTFKFVHGALADTDLKHVQQDIEQVFKYADPPAAAPPAQYAPVTPPPPPPAPDPQPKVLKIGMTMKQVKDGFGAPASIVDLGSKVIYVYGDKKVTFVNGKVSDVDVH